MRQPRLVLAAVLLGFVPAYGQGSMTRTTDGQHPATETIEGNIRGLLS